MPISLVAIFVPHFVKTGYYYILSYWNVQDDTYKNKNSQDEYSATGMAEDGGTTAFGRKRDTNDTVRTGRGERRFEERRSREKQIVMRGFRAGSRGTCPFR
jgi:hypothetical protein